VGVFGRLIVPNEIKAGEEFTVTLEVKASGALFWGITSNLSLPNALETNESTARTVGSLNAGDSRNVTWVVVANEDILPGEYPVEANVYSPIFNTLTIKDLVKIPESSIIRGFQESVFTFMENSINFVSNNPASISLPILILVGLGYLYYRIRR